MALSLLKPNFYFDRSLPIFPRLSGEMEWLYLINENFIGERLIVPLLEEVYLDSRLPSALKHKIYKQIEDERRHQNEYGQYVSHLCLPDSGYDIIFAENFKGLQSCTEKLYALQGILEGVALGAFYHRARYWDTHPAKRSDKNSVVDEIEHVALSYDFFVELKRLESTVPIERFMEVKKLMNSAFKQTFNAEKIETLLIKMFNVSPDQATVDKQSFNVLCQNSRRILNLNSEKFLSRYFLD